MLPCDISNAANTCSICGYISALQDSHDSKAHQLLYVNQCCGTFDTASRLINDLHQDLLARQTSGHHRSASEKRPAVRSTKAFPAFLIFIKCPESPLASSSDGALGVERDVLLCLLRTALFSAWKADIPDDFLQSGIAQPQERTPHASVAAVRDERQRSNLPRQQPHSQAEAAKAALPSNLQHADARKAMQSQASAPAGDARRRGPRAGRQLISSEKRMAWHSAPARTSARCMAAFDQITAAPLQPRRSVLPDGDTAVPQAAAASTADAPAAGSSTWAEVARLWLSPSAQRVIAKQRDAAERGAAVPLSAALQDPTSCLSAAGRRGELLAMLLNEEDLTERVLRSSKLSDHQGIGPPHSQPAHAAAKKRGRRGSWPPLPAAKRRAVHRNPASSLQATIVDLPTSLLGSCSGPGGTSRQPDIAERRQTLTLPDASREAAANGATCEADSANVVQALGWRQRKPGRPEEASRDAASPGTCGTLPTHVAGTEHKCKLRTLNPSRQEQRGELASAPSSDGAPHSVAEPPVTEESAGTWKKPPLDALLAAWRNPCIGPSAAVHGVLQLGDLAPGLAYLTVPQSVNQASFRRARVLQQVRGSTHQNMPIHELLDWTPPAVRLADDSVLTDTEAVPPLFNCSTTWIFSAAQSCV